MSLDQASAAPVDGLSPASATPSDDTSLDNNYEGFTSPDAPEPDDNPTTLEPGIDDENPDALSDEPDPWDGYEDYDVDGETVKIPSKIKEQLLLKADHTRRLQEVAETKKQLQAREQELNTKYQQTEEEFTAWRRLDAINEQLKQADGIDWALEERNIQNDPNLRNDPLGQQERLNQLNAAWRQVQQLKSQQTDLVNTTNNARQQRAAAVEQETATRIGATRQYAEKNIKGWTPEYDSKLFEFALKQGFEAGELRNAINPQIYNMLHLAHIGQQSLSRQQTAKPSAQAQAKPIVPTQTVSAKANIPVNLNPETISIEAFMAGRNSGKIK